MQQEAVSNPFEALFHNANVGIMIVDGKSRITMINRFALKKFGYARKEIIGNSLNTLIPVRFRKSHTHYFKNYLGHPHNRAMGGAAVDIIALKKNGEEFPAEISLGNYDLNGEHFIIAVIVDTTEKIKNKRTIENLSLQIEKTKAKDSELQTLNLFLRSILYHSGALIVVTDPEGTITLFNSAAERMLGYKAEELEGKYTPAKFHCHKETEEETKKLSAELGETIKPGFDTYVAKARRNIENEHEWTMIRKDKSRFTLSLTVSALYNDQKEIIGYIGVGIDISDRKKTEEKLAQSLQKEKDLSELKSRFLSVASHEFRTPLSTILSSVFLLGKYQKTEDQPMRDKHIKRIESSVNILNDILNDILSIEKIEEGKVQVKYTDFNVREYMESIVLDVSPILKPLQRIDYKHIGPEWATLDPSLLKHIVLNLVSNAIKFSPENSTATVRSRVTKHQLSLSVKDQGIGISQEDQQHLFERFFRAANATAIKGTGLGLNIVKKYTDLLNGDISFKSLLNEGTEFTVRFNLKNLKNENYSLN